MKDNFNHNDLDKIIHSRVRLGIMAALAFKDNVEFKFLKEKLELTDGNLSANMTKLSEAGMIEIHKSFVNNKPKTIYQITDKGKNSFKRYVESIEKIIKG